MVARPNRKAMRALSKAGYKVRIASTRAGPKYTATKSTKPRMAKPPYPFSRW